MPVGKTEVKDDSLTIRDVRPADSGLYGCVAKNSMGTEKAKMNLVVQKQPKGLQFFIASMIPGGVLPKKMGRGVRPAFQNPYPIYE